MTSQQLIFKLSNLNIYAKRFVWQFIVKPQLTIVLTVRTVAGSLIAYITKSIHVKRCDDLLLNLAPQVGADGSSREAIRDGGLWKFLTIRQIYPLSNQKKNLSAKKKTLFSPKIAQKLLKFAKICQNFPKNCPKKYLKQSAKNYFDNLLRIH